MHKQGYCLDKEDYCALVDMRSAVSYTDYLPAMVQRILIYDTDIRYWFTMSEENIIDLTKHVISTSRL